MTRPLLILGVRRSGTTLLRVILDRAEEIAIPDESYFIPQLAHRHRGRVDEDAFLDDLRRLPTLVEWGVDPDDVAARLRPGMRAGEAIAAVYEAYAAMRGKARWGDKTPMYMQHLGLLERLFPSALYVHLVRDGRDVALSFLQMPAGIVTRTWAHPKNSAEFACQWRTEVTAARSLAKRVGSDRFLEVRYEHLVGSPEETVRRVCDFAGLRFGSAMLDYVGAVDVSAKPHQQRLRQPPTSGVRSWRSEMSAGDAREFEAIAGDVLADLGYDVLDRASVRPRFVSRTKLQAYRARIRAWNAVAYLLQRSPFWRRRHPRLL